MNSVMESSPFAMITQVLKGIGAQDAPPPPQPPPPPPLAGADSSLRVPPPLLAAVESARIVDEHGPSPHLEYRIECRLGEQRWYTWRRFREFASLREVLKQTVGGSAKAQLPAKGYVRHATSETVACERMEGLSKWLQGVLSESAALGELALLVFLGLASLESKAAVQHRRQPLHVRAIDAPAAESGDVMLFRTRATVPALQRAVTGSMWDHVGVLIFRNAQKRVCRAADRGPDGDSGVIECDMSGTRFYRLSSYEALWHTQYDEIALRQLRWDGRGTDDTIRILDAWMRAVLGTPYLLTVGKIKAHHKRQAAGASRAEGPPAGGIDGSRPQSGPSSDVLTRLMSASVSPDLISPQRRPDAPGDQPAPSAANSALASSTDGGFFCSELVAHAYQALGVLDSECLACGFWPVDFGEAATKGLPLTRGVELGEEVPIDFLTPGVETLVGCAWTQ